MEKNSTTAQSDALELEQMRQQMAALKRRLDNQEIINEQLKRNVMKNRLSWINSYVIFEAVAAPLLIIELILFGIFVIHFSPWFLAYTIFIMIGSLIYNWRFTWVKDSSLLQGDLKNLRKSFVGKKRRIVWENIVTLVLVAIWIPWLIFEIYDYMLTLDPGSFLYICLEGGIVGVSVGSVIGIAIALFINWKASKTYGRVIDQIDELLK